MSDRARRQAAAGQPGIQPGYVDGLDLLQLPIAEVSANVVEQFSIAHGRSGADVNRDPIGLKPIEECRDRQARRIDRGAVLRLGYQTRAFDVCLPVWCRRNYASGVCACPREGLGRRG